jgi:gluconate 2-dehydrogenase gamma chain
MTISRREWMLAAACWAEVLRAQTEKFAWFDPASAAEVNAIACQIIPDDETPGADRAGVIWFIDRALAGYDEDKREPYKSGLGQMQSKRAELFPGSSSIAALNKGQQIQLLRAMEKTEFFQLVRYHTILGFFGHPMYGGNRGEVGWKLVGVEYSMHYEPPFGYYDAEAAQAGSK